MTETEELKSRAIVSKSDYREHKSCHRTSRSLGLSEKQEDARNASFLRTGSGPAGGSSQAEVWAGGRRTALAARTGDGWWGQRALGGET